jgi:hypothetical protein
MGKPDVREKHSARTEFQRTAIPRKGFGWLILMKQYAPHGFVGMRRCSAAGDAAFAVLQCETVLSPGVPDNGEVHVDIRVVQIVGQRFGQQIVGPPIQLSRHVLEDNASPGLFIQRNIFSLIQQRGQIRITGKQSCALFRLPARFRRRLINAADGV